MTDEPPILDDRLSECSGDMVTHMLKSPMHRSIVGDYFTNEKWSRFGEQLRPIEPDVPRFPSHVVMTPIAVYNDGDKLEWKYMTVTTSNGVYLRRVFALRNQAVELDIPSTLSYLSASEGSPQHEAVKAQLEAEAADLVNEVILQIMKDRLDGGDSMLPDLPYTPLK